MLVHEGDTLNIGRDAENLYDINAISVLKGSEIIGYLNQQDSVWLCPLMDGWLVELKGKLLHHCSDAGAPVELTVRTTGGGDAILKPSRKNCPEADLHNFLLTVYFKLGEYSSEMLKTVLHKYSTVMGDVRMLPQTHLIFNIIATRMKELESMHVSIMNNKLMNLSPYNTIK